MILEIDPLTTDIAVRRKGLYERLGFTVNPFPHMHPPYHDGLAGHALLVLSRPEALEEDAYQAFAQYLRAVVMKPMQHKRCRTVPMAKTGSFAK